MKYQQIWLKQDTLYVLNSNLMTFWNLLIAHVQIYTYPLPRVLQPSACSSSPPYSSKKKVLKTLPLSYIYQLISHFIFWNVEFLQQLQTKRNKETSDWCNKKKKHFFLNLHLGVWLVQPAVKVRCQEDRFTLLKGQPFPPASLLFPHCDVYLPLCGLVSHLHTQTYIITVVRKTETGM